MRSDIERLKDILEAIEQILAKTGIEKRVFEQDRMLQVWIIYHLALIGEAASKLKDDVKQVNLEMDWKGIVGMRNTLVHHYFGIDIDEIWNTIKSEIPVLQAQVNELLNKLEKS